MAFGRSGLLSVLKISNFITVTARNLKLNLSFKKHCSVLSFSYRPKSLDTAFKCITRIPSKRKEKEDCLKFIQMIALESLHHLIQFYQQHSKEHH